MIVEAKSNAKINLGLNIVEKNQEGYHILDMIMVPISLSDNMRIDFKGEKGKLKIFSNKKGFPTGSKNIISKIYNLFYKETNLTPELIHVDVEKKIPTQAGLGGGSSNGGFFFNELNKYHGNPISQERAIEITKEIGADIPFFLLNKPARVQGIGEKLEEIENNLTDSVILIKPSFGVSTAVAYKNSGRVLKNKKYRRDARIDDVIRGLKEGKSSIVKKGIENHLEQVLLLEDRKIVMFRKRLKEVEKNNNIKIFMSGSGSCYYTLVSSGETESLLKKLKEELKGCKLYSCKFL